MPKMSAEEKKWRAESDLHTLKEAQEIMKNKDRLAMAKKVAMAQMKALEKARSA